MTFPPGTLSPTASAIWVTNTLGAVIERNSLCGYPLGIRITESQNIIERRNEAGDCGA